MKESKRNLYFKIIGEVYDNLPEGFFINFKVPRDDFYNWLKAMSNQIECHNKDINYIRYKSLKIADKEMIREHFTSIKNVLIIMGYNPKEFFSYFLEEYKDFFKWLNK